MGLIVVEYEPNDEVLDVANEKLGEKLGDNVDDDEDGDELLPNPCISLVIFRALIRDSLKVWPPFRSCSIFCDF